MNFQDRNPSPPPEILKNEELLPDKIGDTVYSKRWTIKSLMNIIEFCDNPKKSPTKSHGGTSVADNFTENSDEIIELDSKIEEDACMLWDMSASEQVAKFLCEHDICNIFKDVIDKTKSPRLLEIIVGILGNMCTYDEICQSISNNSHLVDTIILLSGTTDAPSLIQVVRCIMTGLKNKSCEHIWLAAIKDNLDIMNNIKDIFSNSLNRPLVICTCQLLYTILSKEYQFSVLWGEENLLEAVCVAGRLLSKHKSDLDSFFCIFNAVCQYVPNVEKFAKKWDDIKHLFHDYILSFKKEDCLFECDRAVAVSCYFDSFNTILTSDFIDKNSILIDSEFLYSIARIYAIVKHLVSNVKISDETEESSETLELNIVQEEVVPIESTTVLTELEQEKCGKKPVTMMTKEEFETWNLLLQIIIDNIKTLQNFIKTDELKEMWSSLLSFDPSKDNPLVPIL